MKLLTIGDSFTYGDELTSTSDSWPTLLSTKLNWELTNLAISGSGNTNMVRTTVECASEHDIIIIAWSHWGRIETADEYGIFDTWPGHTGIKFNGTIEFRHTFLRYITEHHDDVYLRKQQLLNIILTQQYLKSLNKKYLMLTAFGNCFDSADTNLINQIDKKYFIGCPDKTMMDWTYGCPQGPGGHFLELGHQKISNIIYAHIRRLGWVS